MDRRTFVQGAGAMLLAAAVNRAAWATQTAPGSRLVFGIPSGAVGSQLADMALELMSRQYQLGYRLDIIEARNTQAAAEAVKVAPGDGSTLLQAHSSSMVLFPSIYKNLAYDPVADFVPLATFGEHALTLTVGPVVPANVRSVDDYVTWVARNPEFRDIGFSLYGSQAHLMALMLARAREIALRPQPYKSPRSLIADMDNGSLAAAVLLPGSSTAAGGRNLRMLAISSPTRLEALPQVPTFAEQSLADLDLTGWYGWFAPVRLAPALSMTLEQKLAAVQVTPEFAALQKKLLMTPLTLSSEQIGARIRKEISHYRVLVDQYGLGQMS
jgi:tripartite-type tricarboxylate transporter receptor subunit TctC